jgi:Zn-dependent peptidase ImmA (M78 family)
MEVRRKNEIEDYAIRIANKYSPGIRVNPYLITQRLGIDVIQGNYDKCFKGLIRYENGRFYIFLNSNFFTNPNFTHARFASAHELAHFFLKEHRNQLKAGKSISFTGNEFSQWDENGPEAEAQHFAACMLMPRDRFAKLAFELPNSFNSILDIKMEFDVSITSSAIRYVESNICPSILVMWNEQKIINKWVSSSFTREVGKTPWIKYNPERYLMETKKHYHSGTEVTFSSGYTGVRSWTENLTERNFQLFSEETFLCQHWNLTLLQPI